MNWGWGTPESRLAQLGAEKPTATTHHARLAREVERLSEALTQRDHALSQAQQLTQAYLDIVGVMVIMLNAKGNIVLANRKACEVLRCGQENQCLGGNWFERFLPDEDRQATWALFQQVMAGKAEVAEFHENHIVTCTGQRRLIAWHNSLLRGRDGRIVGTLSAGEDITETRRIEEALRQSEARLRLAQEAARIGTFEWNVRSGKSIWTPRLEALYGLPPGGFAGSQEAWERLVHPDDLPPIQRKIRHTLSSGEPVEGEWRVVWPDGSVHWLAGRWQAFLDDSGLPLRMTGVNIDITERKLQQEEQSRLQAQLQQAQKMEALGQLTGGIAHDFNNILASVLGFARLARRQHAAGCGDKLAEYLDEIIGAGERARDLVAKMLAFGRAQPVQEPRALAPLPVAEEAVKMLAATIPASIHIETRFEEALPDIAMDPVAFQQILVNLVINARDAVGEKGQISVSLAARAWGVECAACHGRYHGSFVQLCVADTGPGIPPEVQQRMFEPFFTTKAPGKGSGMGLAMVHGLVHGAGGHFRVESAPGQGTRFHVCLPVATALPAEAAEAPRPVSVASAAGKDGCVLLVDDEPAILRLLTAVLAADGWQVDAHDHPLRALAAFQAAPQAYAAVISDQTMPDMTGIELIQALHALRADLPALLCTGYSEYLDEAAALRQGVGRFFMKPVDGDALVASLNALAGRVQPA